MFAICVGVSYNFRLLVSNHKSSKIGYDVLIKKPSTLCRIILFQLQNQYSYSCTEVDASSAISPGSVIDNTGSWGIKLVGLLNASYLVNDFHGRDADDAPSPRREEVTNEANKKTEGASTRIATPRSKDHHHHNDDNHDDWACREATTSVH